MLATRLLDSSDIAGQSTLRRSFLEGNSQPGSEVGSAHRCAISSVMVGDLKAQEVVHRIRGLLGVGGHGKAGAAWNLLQFPMQIAFQARHSCGTGHILAVDQHGSVEVAFGKHARDVLKVAANLLETGSVLEVIGADLDKAAVPGENEVVGSLVMREAHDFIALLVDHGGVIVLTENEAGCE
jgi:hypothetical protein